MTARCQVVSRLTEQVNNIVMATTAPKQKQMSHEALNQRHQIA